MGEKGEKAKNLVGTWKKLLGCCRKYAALFVIAVICAAAGTVLMLAGPDRLSDMTDTITEGISPDTQKLQEIIEAVSNNISQNMENLMEDITASLSDEAAVG